MKTEPSITDDDLTQASQRESFMIGRLNNVVASHQLHIHRRCRDILDLASTCRGDDPVGMRDGEFECLLTDAAASLRKLEILIGPPIANAWQVMAWSMESPVPPDMSSKVQPTGDMASWLAHIQSTDHLATHLGLGAYDLHKAPYMSVSLVDMCHALIHCRLFQVIFNLRPDEEYWMAHGSAIGFTFSPAAPSGKNWHDFRPKDFRIYRVALDDLIAAMETVAWINDDEDVFRARLEIPEGGPDFIDRPLLEARAKAIMKPQNSEARSPWRIARPNHPEDVVRLIERQSEAERLSKLIQAQGSLNP